MDVYKEPDIISDDVLASLGPLTGLVGCWQGECGPGTDTILPCL
jgi:hypothetical protein